MRRYFQILLAFTLAGAAIVLTLAAVAVGGYYYVAPSMPSADELRNIKIQVPLQVYSRDGRLIGEFGEVKRTPVAYENIPPVLVKAILAAEDEHFFEHPGVDYRGILRAILNEIRSSEGNVGGSTLTQQVTRTLNILSRERRGLDRYVRKFKEWVLAFRIEREFTKEEILELYLNTSFFGHRSYGVVTAARTYFGKELDELTVSEVAIIAGTVQRPNVFNPISSVSGTTARRGYVLRRMRETGAIDDAEYQAALADPVVAKRFSGQSQLEAPYVAEMVRAEMIRRFGPAAYTAGLKVTTTIDSRLQKAANHAIRETLTAYDERHGFRGPLAHVELPEELLAQSVPADPGPAVEATGEEAAPDTPAAKLRTLLDDYPSLLDLETAVVLGVEPLAARVYVASSGEQVVGLDAVAWAARYIDDDSTGPLPTGVGDVLRVGDIVRFRHDAEGRWRLAQIPEVQGAFVSVDPRDGAVVALNGGFDFFLSNYNRATQSKRQPGSAFKPFVYSAALENGFTAATIVNDSPPDVGYQPELERVWKPENYGGKYYGPVRLRFALQHSLNAVSIRMMQKMGLAETARHVRRFGFDDVAVPNNLSLALGAGGVAPLDLVRGYATFANGGFRVQNYFIDRITDAEGATLFEARPAFVCADCEEPEAGAPGAEPAPPELTTDVTDLYPMLRLAPRVISPQNAYLITDLLQDVVRVGTGARARRALGRDDLSGKTGTTNEGRDTWFVGFNADVVAAAWVGFEQYRPLGGNEQGGVTAIPMWIDYMREALAGLPEHAMEGPPGIVEYRINPENGLIANDTTPNTLFEKFKIDSIPEREPDSAFPPFNPFGQPNPGPQPQPPPIL